MAAQSRDDALVRTASNLWQVVNHRIRGGLFTPYRERRKRLVVEQLEGKHAGWMEEFSHEPYQG
jgi:hypothetical protein